MPKSRKRPIVYLLFMDESGDTGFKFEKGSSRFFVLSIVIFDNPVEAEKTAKTIKNLRKKLKLSVNFEFKFSTGTTKKQKEKFLKIVKQENFTYRSVVIDKQKLLKANPQSFQESIYILSSELLFLRGKELANATLVLDRVNRQFLRKMNFFLKRRLNTPLRKIIRKIKADKSSNNNLLQLVDMVCGAVYRKFSKKDKKYYDLIKEKEEDLYVPY